MRTNHEEGEGRRSERSRQASRSVLADPEIWALVAIILVLMALIG